MFTKGDKVRFRDDLVREKRFPPYILKVVDAYNMCGESAYDIEDTMTGEKYVAIPEKTLLLVSADSEKISKNKKARFRIRKSMFTGLWFIGCPITLSLYIWLQNYWVFGLLLIPLAVGIFGKDD